MKSPWWELSFEPIKKDFKLNGRQHKIVFKILWQSIEVFPTITSFDKKSSPWSLFCHLEDDEQFLINQNLHLQCEYTIVIFKLFFTFKARIKHLKQNLNKVNFRGYDILFCPPPLLYTLIVICLNSNSIVCTLYHF